MLTRRAVQTCRRKHKVSASCGDLEYNWLGTDDQGRDVVARLIYGFRISVLFGLTLTIISSVDRRRRRRGAGLFRRLDRPRCSSASSRSGPRCRRSICC